MSTTTSISYGYAAAALSSLAFGSFAVPIQYYYARTTATGNNANANNKVDPLVLQTYKIVCCAFVSWAVVAVVSRSSASYSQQSFHFTPWGIVSGLLMVPGGTAGYWAVQTAGLAVSQGIWSSLKVMVAFAWGILIFHEPVRSVGGTCLAMTVLAMGLGGMSYVAVPTSTTTRQSGGVRGELGNSADVDDNCSDRPFLLHVELGAEPNRDDGEVSRSNQSRTKSSWGILGAVMDGLYGGSILVPMHFASPESTQGVAYVGSFAIGCLIVVAWAWLGRFVWYSLQHRSVVLGYAQLPSLQWTTMGPYAMLAGTVWSIGNICSILSVAILGVGLGYSIVQSQLLVAGIWGICLFQEVQGKHAILAWFLFALTTMAGIVLLSQQHR